MKPRPRTSRITRGWRRWMASKPWRRYSPVSATWRTRACSSRVKRSRAARPARQARVLPAKVEECLVANSSV